MKAGIYSTSWDYAGGGEKLLAVTAERLLKAGWQVCLYGNPPPDRDRLETVLSVDLGGCDVAAVQPPYEAVLGSLSRVAPRVARMVRGRTAFSFARGLDLLVYITGEVPPACPARRGLLFVQFPYNDEESIRVDADGQPLRAADREKAARLKSWDLCACPSEFVRKWVQRRWHISPHVVYPPAEIEECAPGEKRPFILTVGRFYATGPTKKHAVMVKAFREMCDSGLEGWTLQVVGGTHPREDHQRYLNDVRALAEGYPIEVMTDLTFREVLQLYRQASLYWHATGAGESPSTHPQLFEQFGMTIVEAMACGAVPLVFDGGGPAEIVRDGKDGFVWNDTASLIARSRWLMDSPDVLECFRAAAVRRAAEFSRGRFEAAIDSLLTVSAAGVAA